MSTSTMESPSPFKTMWANLSKSTPELSPEQQAIQVFLEQRMQAQGLQDPQDLGGLVVNLEFGNVGLEEDVVQAIVGDNPPVGAVEVLQKASLVAHGGMKSWSSVAMSKIERVHKKEVQAQTCMEVESPPGTTKGSSSSLDCSDRMPSARLVYQAQKRLDKVKLGGGTKKQLNMEPVPELSLQGQAAEKMKKAIERCMALLLALGDCVPRFRALFLDDSGEKVDPPDERLQVQRDCFKAGLRNAETIDELRRGVERAIQGMKALKINPFGPDAWGVATYLTSQRSRGKTGPKRAYRHLQWYESCFGVVVHLEDSRVLSQVEFEDTSQPKEAPKPAKNVTTEMVKRMEVLVEKAPTRPLRSWSGFFAGCAHGCLRGQDMQRSRDLKMTADALVGKSWMKNFDHLYPWGILREGYEVPDWPKKWLMELAKDDLPGKDFVMLKCNDDFSQYKPQIAKFSDMQAAMHTLLTLGGFMSVEQAVLYNPQSWRHYLASAASQLGLKKGERTDMGHWKPGSSMPHHYDTVMCASELRAKEKVRRAIAQGWDLVGPGCIPKDVVEAMKTSPKKASKDSDEEDEAPLETLAHPSKKTKLQIPESDEKVVESESLQVMNTKSHKIHLWKSGTSTVCNKWMCGQPQKPSEFAEFHKELADVPNGKQGNTYCRGCYGTRLSHVLGINASEEDAWIEALRALDEELGSLAGGGKEGQSPSGFETPSSSSDGLSD